MRFAPSSAPMASSDSDCDGQSLGPSKQLVHNHAPRRPPRTATRHKTLLNRCKKCYFCSESLWDRSSCPRQLKSENNRGK